MVAHHPMLQAREEMPVVKRYLGLLSQQQKKKGRKKIKKCLNRHLIVEGRGLTDLSSAVFREFSEAHCKHFCLEAYAPLSEKLNTD